MCHHFCLIFDCPVIKIVGWKFKLDRSFEILNSILYKNRTISDHTDYALTTIICSCSDKAHKTDNLFGDKPSLITRELSE